MLSWRARGLACAVFLMVGLMAGAWPALAQLTPPERLLVSALDKLATSSQRIGPYDIASGRFLKQLYEHRNFRHAWNSVRNVAALKAAITEARNHGLAIDDFHAAALGMTPPKPSDRRLLGFEQDIVMSDALVRLLYQLHYGKVDPARLDADWNFDRPPPPGNTVELISAALVNGPIEKLLATVRPEGENYDRLEVALAKYRAFEADGGWPATGTHVSWSSANGWRSRVSIPSLPRRPRSRTSSMTLSSKPCAVSRNVTAWTWMVSQAPRRFGR